MHPEFSSVISIYLNGTRLAVTHILYMSSFNGQKFVKPVNPHLASVVVSNTAHSRTTDNGARISTPVCSGVKLSWLGG